MEAGDIRRLAAEALRAGPSSDVAALCLSLTEKAVVLCVDEKSQALDRTAPCLPLVSATPAG